MATLKPTYFSNTHPAPWGIQWQCMGNRLELWKLLLGLAFFPVADILPAYETARDTWHSAAIDSFSTFSKVFPLIALKG
jgi:hypothetical protein